MAARAVRLSFTETGGGVVFGVRAEVRRTRERKDGGVGGAWEDKANQTVNNRGTAERNGSKRRGMAPGGRGGGVKEE